MNPQRVRPATLGLMLAVLLLAACGSPATPTPPTIPPTQVPAIVELPTVVPTSIVTPTQTGRFPVGLFDCVECQGMRERYSDDGTLIVYLRGVKYISGRWYVENDIFHTGDSFCRDEDAMPASYKWHFDGQILTFQVVEEQCSDRRGSLDGKPWKLIE